MLLTWDRGQFAEYVKADSGIPVRMPQRPRNCTKVQVADNEVDKYVLLVRHGGGKWTFAKKGDRSARKVRTALVVSSCRDSRGQSGAFGTTQSISQRRGFLLRLHA